MTLNHVTFTGVDAKTDLHRVVELSDRYPIEWGVLHSRTSKSQRYPQDMDLERIEDFGADRGLMLAAHVCGSVSREFQTRDGWDVVNPYIYGRIQVNSGSYEDTMDNLRHHLDMFGNGGTRIILQHRDGVFPNDPDFDFLLDRSGGRGVVETEFPSARSGTFCGYAGGIGPENVAEVLENIGVQHRFWIDMESGVRTDDWLDLDKCAAVCQTIWPDQ